ncbi:hypothetical protein O6H91_Y366500 [Diphasiastrum complanatum]|nr:hypothetical protein O6H91_Y366500 [Diphasiastrum complanatum]
MEGHNKSILQGIRGKKVLLVPILALSCGLFIILDLQSMSISNVLVHETNKNWQLFYRSEREYDYSQGKWVLDAERPLYSGNFCKRFLSAGWACRLTNRPDFEFERYRWQPHDCNLPPFDSHTFLRRMRNKTIAFVGDSLGRQQFQSLMCMLTGGKNSILVHDVGTEFGFGLRPPFGARPDGWAYNFVLSNTTVVYSWSSWLGDVQKYNESDPSSASALHLDRPSSFLRNYIHKLDAVVLNTGHHWNRGKFIVNKIELHVNGSKELPKKLTILTDLYNYTLRSVAKFMDIQIAHNPGLRVFITTLSPRHFRNGDWDSGGTCENNIPFGETTSSDPVIDPVAEGAILNTKVQLLNITYLSQLRGEAHMSKYSITAKKGAQDCLHWCLPGVPDTWNEILYAKLIEDSDRVIS